MSEILRDLPIPILTPRLMIRPPRAGDGAEINAAIVRSFDRIRPWLPWADKIPTPEQTEQDVREAQARWIRREDLRLLMFDRASGSFVGGTGLHRINWKIPQFEIGYWLATPFEGKGLVTEATIAMTRYAFEALGAKRVEIRVDPLNVRSVRVPEALGFEFEGQLRRTIINHDGVLGDLRVYARLEAAGLPSLDTVWGETGA